MKKLSVCGKGGTGKSTVVALMARELSGKGKEVVVIDSDESNSELYRMLGLGQPPRPLLELAGGKKNVIGNMRTSFSPGEGEPDAALLKQERIRLDDIPADYVVRRNRLRLIAVGKIHQALEGCACPMGALSREFLKRLTLAENQMAIVDMEAGIEHFGRGVETSVDAVIAVIEPSMESVTLTAKVKDLAMASGARFAGVVANKIPSDEVESRLISELDKRQLHLLVTVHRHQEIANSSLMGDELRCAEATVEIAPLLNSLITVSLPTSRSRAQESIYEGGY